jgi:hypothetical protein
MASTLSEFADIFKQEAGPKHYKKWDSYEDFLTEINPPEYSTGYTHIQVLIQAVEGLLRGDYDNLAIHMPPRHGKSETITNALPIYFLLNYPKSAVCVACHTIKLAQKFGDACRKKMSRYGILSKSTKAKDAWETTLGGRYVAGGMAAAPTGEGFNLIIFDDPIKTMADAQSPKERETLEQCYFNDYLSRKAPGCKTILIGTKWTPEDLYTKATENNPERWKIITLPAISIDEDGEEQALWPEIWPIPALLRRKQELLATEASGDAAWEAQYQQNPIPKTGIFFRTDLLRQIPSSAIPRIIQTTRAWDVAYSKGKGDWTVGVRLGRDKEGNFYILDIARAQLGPFERDEFIKKTIAEDIFLCQRDRIGYKVLLPEDPAAGTVQTIGWIEKFNFLSHELASMGCYIEYYKAGAVGIRTSGPLKESRAHPLAAYINGGLISMVKAVWNNDFIKELGLFPSGSHDDQVDAAAAGFADISFGLTNSAEVLADAAKTIAQSIASKKEVLNPSTNHDYQSEGFPSYDSLGYFSAKPYHGLTIW